MKRQGFIVTFLILLSLNLIACHKTSDEQKLRIIIEHIQKAAEEKKASGIMEHISSGYSDSRGFNHETLKQTLRGYFFRFPKISAYINKRDISIAQDSARIIVQTILTSGTKTGSLTDAIPESLGIYIFDVSLKKEANDWKIVTATWKRVSVNPSDEQ